MHLHIYECKKDVTISIIVIRKKREFIILNTNALIIWLQLVIAGHHLGPLTASPRTPAGNRQSPPPPSSGAHHSQRCAAPRRVPHRNSSKSHRPPASPAPGSRPPRRVFACSTPSNRSLTTTTTTDASMCERTFSHWPLTGGHHRCAAAFALASGYAVECRRVGWVDCRRPVAAGTGRWWGGSWDSFWPSWWATRHSIERTDRAESVRRYWSHRGRMRSLPPCLRTQWIRGAAECVGRRFRECVRRTEKWQSSDCHGLEARRAAEVCWGFHGGRRMGRSARVVWSG